MLVINGYEIRNQQQQTTRQYIQGLYWRMHERDENLRLCTANYIIFL